ncbi:MAG TPA: hypothetical protein VF705_13670 [Longimicrobium sp.]|jgi:hypothetical protein
MKHRLNLDTLAVQSFETQARPENVERDTYKNCISDVSHCGVCPTEPGTQV